MNLRQQMDELIHDLDRLKRERADRQDERRHRERVAAQAAARAMVASAGLPVRNAPPPPPPLRRVPHAGPADRQVVASATAPVSHERLIAQQAATLLGDAGLPAVSLADQQHDDRPTTLAALARQMVRDAATMA